MATIVTRSGKGSALTHNEVDANFNNLNNDKLETSAAYVHPTTAGNKHVPAGGSSGQILGYASAGTAQWQASPSSDLVDDTSPQLGGDLATNGNDVLFADNDKLKFGADPNLEIYHDGGSSYIDDIGSGSLAIRTNGFGINMMSTSSEWMGKFVPNGNVELYYDNAKKFETTATGIDVTGAITVNGSALSTGGGDVVSDTSPQLGGNLESNGHDVLFADNDKALFGAGSDLQIYHDGSNSYIKEDGTGVLKIQAADLELLHADGSRGIRVNNDGGPVLYNNGSSIVTVNSGGIILEGNLTVTGTVDGRDIATNIPSSLGSAGQVLTVNSGGSAAEWAAAGGGANLELFAENPNSPTAPSATGANSVSIGPNATSSASQSIAIGSGTVASHAFAVAIGYNAQANTAFGATALTNSYASGQYSFAAAIANNTSSYGATGASSVAMGPNAIASGYGSLSLGKQNTASASYSTVVGSYVSTASANYSGVFGGRTNTASSTYATVVGGTTNVASGQYSAVIGGLGNTASGEYGVAMGESSTASHNNSVSIGNNVQSTAHSQINLGGTGDTVRISETYTLPSADGNANQVLQTNGSGALSFATVSGGGGADLYAANESSPANQPTAAGANAIGIGDTAQAAGADGVAIGLQSYARAQSALGLFGDAQNASSVAIGAGSATSADRAVALGANSQALGTQAVSVGKSRASGTDSFAAAIGNNTSSYGASGANSIAIGRLSKATGDDSFAIGDNNIVINGDAFALGNTNNVSGGATAFAIGTNHTVSGTAAACIGGSTSTATQTYAMTFGPYAKAAVQNAFIFGSKGWFSAGSAQGGMYILYADTTDATAEALTTTNSTAGSTNQIVAASDTCITFSGTITAMQNGAQSYGSWEIKGLLVNDGGTTTLANSAITVIQNASSWGVALSADNTNNSLAITVTGEASHSIRWVSNISTSEVTFA